MAGFKDTNHAMGTLLGGAAGDALGTTLEFTHPKDAPWTTLLPGPHTTITGMGPFRVAKGQVTDDTQMAVTLARSLASKGFFDVEDVASRYEAWSKKAFDIGGQTRGSLSARHDHKRGGQHYWISGGRRAAGNGSLMRTWPIGVFYANEKVARRAASILDSAVTHFDPRCMIACAAYNAAIACAVRGNATRADMWQAAMEEIPKATRYCAHRWPQHEEEIKDAEVVLTLDLKRALDPDPKLYGEEGLHIVSTQGFVRVAFRLAFWALVHAPSYSAGLIDAVNRGGDADTNGAIVGALLGAFFGESGIPAEWVKAVLESNATGTWAIGGKYHPSFFAEVVAREEEPEDPSLDIIDQTGSTPRERAEVIASQGGVEVVPATFADLEASYAPSEDEARAGLRGDEPDCAACGEARVAHERVAMVVNGEPRWQCPEKPDRFYEPMNPASAS